MYIKSKYLLIIITVDLETIISIFRFGNQIEVRAAYRNQNLPIFVRMFDKDSKWSYEKGLKTLIPTALTYSVIGYPYILPDMIGGFVSLNSYFYTKRKCLSVYFYFLLNNINLLFHI